MRPRAAGARRGARLPWSPARAETHPASDGGREGDVRRTAVIRSGERLGPDDPPLASSTTGWQTARNAVESMARATRRRPAVRSRRARRAGARIAWATEANSPIAGRSSIIRRSLFIVGGHDADQGDELAVDLDGRHPPAPDPERRHGIAVGARFGGRGPAVGPRAGARASEQAPGDAWRKGVAGTHRESRQADDREGEHALIRALEWGQRHHRHMAAGPRRRR